MFNLELQWIQKCDVNQDTFYNGEEVVCVKPNGQMFKLAYNEEKGCFVDRLGE